MGRLYIKLHGSQLMFIANNWYIYQSHGSYGKMVFFNKNPEEDQVMKKAVGVKLIQISRSSSFRADFKVIA